MLKKNLFFILAFSSIIGLSQEVKQDKRDIAPKVYLIGSIHNMHFNPDNHYSVNDLLSQIQALKADLVCGEITHEAYNQPMEGYFPPEAAFLAEMASESNYRFVPVDWRLDHATQTMASGEFPASVKEKRSALLNEVQAKLKASTGVSFYDILHDSTIINSLDSLYERIIGPNALAEIASGSWHERNRRAVENGVRSKGDARTIVFVFGIDHLPQLQRQLQALGIEAQIPGRLFIPGNSFQVSTAVLARWKRNVENLKLIRDKKIAVPLDDYQKVLDSKRIENLEEAIEKLR
jgi:hypothetical protein